MEDKKEMLIKTYDATVKEYVKHEFNNPSMEKHYKKFLSLIPKNSKILDAGCGPGQASKKFSEKGYSVLGIDLSKEMVSFAKEKVPKAKFLVMNIENITLKEKFDANWAAFILVHVPREKHKTIIEQFKKLLTPNGILFLGMLEGKGEKIMPEPYNRNYKQYFVFVSKKEIENYLQSQDFKILNYSTEEFDEEGDKFVLSFTYAKLNKQSKHPKV